MATVSNSITGTKVEDIREQLRRYHGRKRGDQQLDDLFYNQNSEALAREQLPNDIPIYKSSLATDVVDEVSDQLRTDEPNVIFQALTDSNAETTRKRQIEGLGVQVITDDQLGQDVDAYAQGGLDLALRGEAVIKRLHNTDIPEEPVLTDFSGRGRREKFDEAHAKWDAEIAATSPLLPARPIDPLNCFIPPNAVNPLPYIVEHQRRRQVDMWEQYPDWRPKLANQVFMKDGEEVQLGDDELNDPLREVDWLEYWSTTQYIVIVDGIELIKKENPYGFVPYSHSYSGLGRSDERADSSAKAASILSKIRGELLAEIVLKTIMYELAQSYVFPRIKVPDGREDVIREGMRHRGILRYDPADPLGPNSIDWLDPIEINPAVGAFLREAQGAVARRVNPILSGSNESADFGILEALRLGQAAKGIQKITNSLNSLATESVRQAAKMIIALDLEMNITGTVENGGRDITVSKKDLKAYKQITVEFEAVDPVEQTRKQQAGMVLFRGDAISRRTFQTEYLPDIVKDPVQEDTRMGVEAASAAFYQSEAFLQWAIANHEAAQAERDAREEQGAVKSQVGSVAQSEAPGTTASRTSTAEALAGGGATAAERDNAQGALNEAT